MTDGWPAIAGLWDFGWPDRSEARFRDLLARVEAVGAGGERTELLTQIARAHAALAADPWLAAHEPARLERRLGAPLLPDQRRKC
jgi:hypothetical protein